MTGEPPKTPGMPVSNASRVKSLLLSRIGGSPTAKVGEQKTEEGGEERQEPLPRLLAPAFDLPLPPPPPPEAAAQEPAKPPTEKGAEEQGDPQDDDQWANWSRNKDKEKQENYKEGQWGQRQDWREPAGPQRKRHEREYVVDVDWLKPMPKDAAAALVTIQVTDQNHPSQFPGFTN